MKKIFYLFFLMSFSLNCFCQTDTALLSQITTLKQNIVTLRKSVDSLSAKPSQVSVCYDCERKLSLGQKLLILSPILLFLVFVLYLAMRLKKEGFKLADALDETDPKTKTIPNPEYNAATATLGTVPTTIEVTDTPNRSTSRTIAFLSGLAAIVIAICSVSYFFYMYFRTGKEPDISKIYDVLLALGIGVTPYAFNKLSDAVKGK